MTPGKDGKCSIFSNLKYLQKIWTIVSDSEKHLSAITIAEQHPQFKLLFTYNRGFLQNRIPCITLIVCLTPCGRWAQWLSGIFVGRRVLFLTGSSLDTNSTTFFVLQSLLVVDV